MTTSIVNSKKKRTTVTLDSGKLNELMKMGKFRSKAKAVETAVEDALWRSQVAAMFADMGLVDIDPDAGEWRHLGHPDR